MQHACSVGEPGSLDDKRKRSPYHFTNSVLVIFSCVYPLFHNICVYILFFEMLIGKGKVGRSKKVRESLMRGEG